VSVHINQTKYPQEYALHTKYAQSERLLDLVWTHCNIINDIVIQLYQAHPEKYTFPLEVAIQAALCHDIGVYLCSGFEWIPDQPTSQLPYAQHTIVGAWILYQEGYLPEVVQVANMHSGVGLTANDVTAHQLQLPVDNYVPTTPMQRLLCYASKFHSKTPRFKTSAEIKDSLTQFGEDKLATFNSFVEEFGEPDLETISCQYEEWHKAFAYDISSLNSPQHAGFNSAGITTRQQ
jgi:uncharacterized protein